MILCLFHVIAKTLSVSSKGSSRVKFDMRFVDAAARKVCPYTSK